MMSLLTHYISRKYLRKKTSFQSILIKTAQHLNDFMIYTKYK